MTMATLSSGVCAEPLKPTELIPAYAFAPFGSRIDFIQPIKMEHWLGASLGACAGTGLEAPPLAATATPGTASARPTTPAVMATHPAPARENARRRRDGRSFAERESERTK